MSILAIVGGLITAFVVGGFLYLTNMPSTERRGPLPPLTVTEAAVRDRLFHHVDMLAARIGGRSARQSAKLQEAADFIERELKSFGYDTSRQTYEFGGQQFENIEAERKGTGRADEIVIIGAHYDTAGGLPGANDNGSGVAATLELARLHATKTSARTVRFVLFANEEPPFFQGEGMGSLVYAKRCRERNEKITAMLSLETIGYYSDEPGSQRYPVGFHPGYPSEGNYLGFVSNVKSAPLLRRVVKHFRAATSLPSQGAAAPEGIPGVGWSDHWSFWQYGYKGIVVTDTAPYRYPHYHTAQDTPDKLDYDRMARAITGLSAVVQNLANN
jgi:hypothetical protein